MPSENVPNWYDNELGERFQRKYRLRIVATWVGAAIVLYVIIMTFYVAMVHSEGTAASMMRTMILVVVLVALVVSSVGAVHKIRWGRTVPSRVGISDHGIWFEYRRGRRVFVSAGRLVGVRRMRWMGLNHTLVAHWGYLPIPDGKFVTDEIAHLVSKRFRLQQRSVWPP